MVAAIENTLNNFLIQLGLEDLRFFSSMFTWINQQCNNVLVNMKWKCNFAVSEAFFLSFGILNHFLMLVKLVYMPKRKAPFKYFDS